MVLNVAMEMPTTAAVTLMTMPLMAAAAPDGRNCAQLAN
jgi:hypothetical protein